MGKKRGKAENEGLRLMFYCTFQLVRKAFAKIIMSTESYKLKVESLITRGVDEEEQ